jgi:hypothetical protein
MWCDPRNGSDAAFQKCLADLGAKSGHSELAKVPWALWGHSGGGHWAGGMVMLHPDRVVAAWLRSGVPLLKDDPNRKGINAHKLPDAALKVPLMCNLGTKEGVTSRRSTSRRTGIRNSPPPTPISPAAAPRATPEANAISPSRDSVREARGGVSVSG